MLHEIARIESKHAPRSIWNEGLPEVHNMSQFLELGPDVGIDRKSSDVIPLVLTDPKLSEVFVQKLFK